MATPVRAEPKNDGGVAQLGKFRPVQNLSKAGEEKRSVNCGIQEKNSRVKYKTAEDAAEYTILMKRRTGELVYFSKFDQKAALRLLPIHPSQFGLLGFRDNESPPVSPPGESVCFVRLLFYLIYFCIFSLVFFCEDL